MILSFQTLCVSLGTFCEKGNLHQRDAQVLLHCFLELSFSDINSFGHLLRKGVNYISHFCLGIGNLEPACTVG